MKAIIAHPGTQYSYQVACALERLDLLAGFHTGLAIAKNGKLENLLRLLPQALQKRLANRIIGDLSGGRLHTYPLVELAALWKLHRGGNVESVLHRRNEQFQRAIPATAIQSADVVIGFDTSSWLLAQRSGDAGIPLILDQSIGHPDSKKSIYAELLAHFPEWQSGIESRLAVVRQAEQFEHDSARLVVAASSFTRNTLVENGVEPSKIRVNPYGVDVSHFEPLSDRGGKPLRFVFVGSITARKGVPQLLQAWQRLKPPNAELWLIGPMTDAVRRLIPAMEGLKVWGGVPHVEIPSLLSQCDVFVFPSYFEGFGLVLLEAMACGLPIITTTATAGPDILGNGDGGWIVEPGDLDGLVKAMDYCLSHPEEARDMGRIARAVAERNTWDHYGERWADIFIEIKKQ